MKQAKNILSQITTPAEAEREDENTETTPLHPMQLQQFLQQLNWQEQHSQPEIKTTKSLS
jgi:hypothetical protein